MRSGLLEIPSQLVEHLGLERRHQLIPDDLLGPLTDVRELRRHDDPERPRRQRPEQGGVAQEEDAELVQPGIGDDVDDHAAAGRDGCRSAGGLGSTAPCGRHPRRRRRGAGPPARSEVNVVRCAAFSSAVPSHTRSGSSTMASSTIRRWMAWFSVTRFPQSALRLADRRVERALIDVIDARAVVPAVVHRGVAEPHELGEELPRLLRRRRCRRSARTDAGRRRRRGA